MNAVKDVKAQALEISNRHPFKDFEYQAHGPDVRDEAGGTVSHSPNHLDAQFMALLEEGAHLDVARMPL